MSEAKVESKASASEKIAANVGALLLSIAGVGGSSYGIYWALKNAPLDNSDFYGALVTAIGFFGFAIIAVACMGIGIANVAEIISTCNEPSSSPTAR